MSRDEGEPLAAFGAERQRESRIHVLPHEQQHGEKSQHLGEAHQNRHRLERPAGENAHHHTEDHHGQQVVDHAASDDHPGDPGLSETEILERRQGDHDGGGGHGQADEGGTDPPETRTLSPR